MSRVRPLSLPAWIVAVTIPVFIGTWVLAPSETLSGTVGSATAPHIPVRQPNEPPPIMQLHHPRVQREPALHPTIYGLEQTWKVAFTFDDGPHLAHTRRLLDILRRHEVKATFFINGYWLDEQHRCSALRAQQLVRQAYREGHGIGNHTFGHVRLSHLSPEEQTWQIVANHELITRVTGRPPTLFRPPYATMTDHTRQQLQELGYTEALWSATAPDQEIDDPTEIKRTVMSWLLTYNGGIVMLHDRFRWSVDATELILRSLDRLNCRRLRRGRPTFEAVSLDSFLRPPPQSGALHVEVEQQRHMERLRRICSR